MVPTRLAAHLLALAAIAALTLILVYVSRFWIWTAPWANDGLLGIKPLAPWGDVLRRLLGGTWFRDFDIVIWGCAGFVLLSVLERLVKRRG